LTSLREGEGKEGGRTLLSLLSSRAGDVVWERGGWGDDATGATTTLLGVEVASLSSLLLSSSQVGKVLGGKGGRGTTTMRWRRGSVVVVIDNVNSDPAPPPYKAVGQESDGTPAAALCCLGGIGGAA
jgi:hypothetical protein